MNFHRSFLWRIALVYAAFFLTALAVLLVAPIDFGNGSGWVYLFLGLWAAVASLLSTGLSYLLLRHTSRSVYAVVRGSQRLAAGELDYRIPPASGETREVTDSFNRMADSLKEVIGHLSTERDTLSAVLDTMADGVIVTEPSGRILLFNPASRELMGFGEQPVEGSRLIELVRDNEIHRLVSRCQADKTRQQGEVSLLYPRRYISAIATPLDGTGARGVLLTLHDLTRHPPGGNQPEGVCQQRLPRTAQPNGIDQGYGGNPGVRGGE